MSLKIKLWGVRGSLPAPTPPDQLEKQFTALIEQYEVLRAKQDFTPKDFIRSLSRSQLGGYGGHTACIEVSSPQTRLIVDGGSGISRLSNEIMREGQVGKAKIHILMTHFHWDHLIGLPFFTPLFIPGNEIHFHAVHPDLEENIRRVFCKPNFPVEFKNLPAKIFFHKLEPRKPVMFQDILVTPYQLDHPDPCWGFRFEHKGKVFSYCVDTECTRASREQLGADLPLYQNVDLMVFDAQYTFLEATERVNWGHASGPIGIDLALREKVKRILFVHHDPGASAAKIADIEKQTKEYYDNILRAAQSAGLTLSPLEWGFAAEGTVIEL